MLDDQKNKPWTELRNKGDTSPVLRPRNSDLSDCLKFLKLKHVVSICYDYRLIRNQYVIRYKHPTECICMNMRSILPTPPPSQALRHSVISVSIWGSPLAKQSSWFASWENSSCPSFQSLLKSYQPKISETNHAFTSPNSEIGRAQVTSISWAVAQLLSLE